MRNLLLGAVALMLLGCSGGGTGSKSQPETATRTRGSSSFIPEAEIAGSQYQNALDVVQNLRPSMLITRGVEPVIVYMDDVRLGEPATLTNIPVGRVKEIRYLNARDATTRFGTGHSGGVILVTTKR